jgi:prepilin-type N-terminal cleavage/methylation domain-containing protein
MRRTRRGFTLIEVMVAAAIVLFATLAVMRVGTQIARSSTHEGLRNDLANRTRTVFESLRQDAEAAGYGSTGAIGVDQAVPPWNLNFGNPTSWARASAQGKFAIPAIQGVNNAAGGGAGELALTDAVMMVVPELETSRPTWTAAAPGATFLTMTAPPLAPPYNPCPATGDYCCHNLLYISDHSSPDGSGRTQVLQGNITAGAAPQLNVMGGDKFVFEIGPQSEVFCARISTYWVDSRRWLHRSDLNPAGPFSFINGNNGVVGGYQLITTILPAQGDVMAPGIMDMQLAYRFSSAAVGIVPTATPENKHWFTGKVADHFPLGSTNDWFEVRRIRVSFIARSLRPDDSPPAGTFRFADTPAEDGNVNNWRFSEKYSRYIHSSEAVLPNLRIFDYGADPTATAEPY